MACLLSLGSLAHVPRLFLLAADIYPRSRMRRARLPQPVQRGAATRARGEGRQRQARGERRSPQTARAKPPGHVTSRARVPDGAPVRLRAAVNSAH